MSLHVSFSALSVMCLLVTSGAGRSQENGDQRRAMKPDGPGPVHRRLDDLVGNWDVAVQYKFGDKMQDGKANCEAKWILDGKFLQQDYNSRFQGKRFHVLQLLGYDNARKKTIEIMLDNLSTGLLHNEGSISDDGKVITNAGERRDSTAGKPYKLRTVTTIIDHDHFTLEWFRTDEGAKEERVVCMTHTRKSP
jgi:hypothetical protein